MGVPGLGGGCSDLADLDLIPLFSFPDPTFSNASAACFGSCAFVWGHVCGEITAKGFCLAFSKFPSTDLLRREGGAGAGPMGAALGFQPVSVLKGTGSEGWLNINPLVAVVYVRGRPGGWRIWICSGSIHSVWSTYRHFISCFLCATLGGRFPERKATSSPF